MRPTPRAIALQESFEHILRDIEQLVTELVFTPNLAQETLRIAASDYATTIILPTVLKHLAQKSPHIDIECYDWHPETLDRLRNGEIDLCLGVVDIDGSYGIRTQNLFLEHCVSIVRKDHPILESSITLDSYISSPHALITITGSPIHSIKKSTKSSIDRRLEELGVKWRVMLKLPHFPSAALIISQTDMILTLPRRIALLFTNVSDISIFEPPISLGEYHYMQIRSKRCDRIPFQIWLRNLISSQTQNI
ncbi:MAG: hypothetical protein DCF19_14630 [Pseudanabaena frigida]|uniref:LysR substrate-binding domain-containing protein n=1 Tax=Pseudanabaena frigida TaxID=945775 RepID=A0A2W4W1Y5_9CYAN|nr:MAG: hypothetical protein DCF19_14630 [Pseudanabaena frigida]